MVESENAVQIALTCFANYWPYARYTGTRGFFFWKIEISCPFILSVESENTG